MKWLKMGFLFCFGWCLGKGAFNTLGDTMLWAYKKYLPDTYARSIKMATELDKATESYRTTKEKAYKKNPIGFKVN